MSSEFTTDRLIAAWLSGEAPTGAPDGLRDHVVSTTATLRPRPVWLARLKGNHMDVIAGGRSRQRLTPRHHVPVLVVVGLLLVVAIGALVVGSQLRKPVPVQTRYGLPGPAFQVITGSDGVFASSFDGSNTTAIYRLSESGTWTPVVTDLPSGHVAFVVAGDSIWGVASDSGGSAIQWDATTGERLQAFHAGAMPLEPLVAYDAVWVPIYRDNKVVRIDPTTGAATPIDFPAGGARDLAAGGGRIWVADPGATNVYGIDVTTHQVTASDPILAQLCGVSYAADRVWALRCGEGDVHVLDPASGVVQGTLDAGGAVGDVFEHDGRVWAMLRPTGTDRNLLVNVDPATLEVLGEYDTGLTGELSFPALTDDAIWFGAGEAAVRIPFALLPSR
jgi:hypothetical protein